MGSQPPATPDDRLTQMVQAAVAASLARRTAILKPREVRELTAEARAALEDLVRRRDADLQRAALLDRAREKLVDELLALQGDLVKAEERLAEARRAEERALRRADELSRECEGRRAEFARKSAELEEVAERRRPVAEARTMASEEGARELDRQLARLDAGRDALAREVSLLHESIREREGELEETRAESRAARETAEALERGNASLAESIRQKRGIEAKVLEEASRVAEALAGVAERMAALERGAELGPVVVEMRREVERAREEGREDRVRLAQSEAQLRDAQDAAARAAAAAAHLRETLAAVEAERDRIEDLLRRERRQGADRTRSFGKRLEELEARPPAGSDPAAWERLQAQFESRLRDSARRVAELESETAAMRAELENARSLLARATVERQQLRARLESMEMASVSAAAGGQADALRADLRRTELERDEARRDIAALKSRIDTLEHSRKELEGRRAKAEEELRSRSGEGFFRKIARAFARE